MIGRREGRNSVGEYHGTDHAGRKREKDSYASGRQHPIPGCVVVDAADIVFERTDQSGREYLLSCDVLYSDRSDRFATDPLSDCQ